MANRILFFGQLSEITGLSHLMQDNPALKDIDSLKEYLFLKYPGLKAYNFRISVNGEIHDGNTSIKPDDEIALLPPFAGG